MPFNFGETWPQYAQLNMEKCGKKCESTNEHPEDIDLCWEECADAMWSHLREIADMYERTLDGATSFQPRLDAYIEEVKFHIQDKKRALEWMQRAVSEREKLLKVAQVSWDENTCHIGAEFSIVRPLNGSAKSNSKRHSITYDPDGDKCQP